MSAARESRGPRPTGSGTSERSRRCRADDGRWLADQRDLHFDDYHSLWRWSVTELEEFWGTIWDYFEVIASRAGETRPRRELEDDPPFDQVLPELSAMEGTIHSVLERVHVTYPGADGQKVEGFFPGPTYSYEKLPGWKTSTEGIVEYDKLPKAAREYLAFVEQQAGAKVGMISTGPDRGHTILRPEFVSELKVAAKKA